MQQVLTEFAAPQATPLSAMLKGGYYVPSNVGGGTIPTVLPLDLSDFLGAVRPALVTIDSVEAVSGSVSSTISGLTASVNLAHAAKGPSNTSVTAIATCRVNFKLVRATTPRVRLTAQAGNAAVDGIYRRIYGGAGVPVFDNGGLVHTNSGPSTTDVAGGKQGLWTLNPAFSAVDLNDRLSGSQVLSNAAVDGDIVSTTFTMTHTVKAYIAESMNFNDVFTHNASGGRAVFQLAMLFLDGSNNIIQEVPISITVATSGQASAFATAFAP